MGLPFLKYHVVVKAWFSCEISAVRCIWYYTIRTSCGFDKFTMYYMKWVYKICYIESMKFLVEYVRVFVLIQIFINNAQLKNVQRNNLLKYVYALRSGGKKSY